MAFNHILSDGLGRRYSRRGVLKGGVALGAGAAALSAFGFTGLGFAPSAAAAAGPLDSDLEILNYALTLEYLEAEAYRVINSANVLTGRAALYFREFGAHEAAHRDAIIATIRQLGGTPVAMPTFNFSSVPTAPAEIVKFFQMVEAVGVSAYLGAAPSIKNLDILEAALTIHAVEAEHAAALADLVAPGTNLFSPSPFETPRTPAEVLQIVGPFLAATPGMPNTGGGFAAGGADLINRELARGR